MNKDQWASLNPKQQWDCLVALRGPDCYDSDRIKWFTTAVIRGQMASIIRVGGLVNTEFKLVILPEGLVIHNPTLPLEKSYIFRWCADHFFVHTYEAASHLGVPILYISGDMWLKLAQSSFHKMIPELILHCETYRYTEQLEVLKEIMKWHESGKKGYHALSPPISNEGGF